MSLPSRGRGLKFETIGYVDVIRSSLPSRGRGLKLYQPKSEDRLLGTDRTRGGGWNL